MLREVSSATLWAFAAYFAVILLIGLITYRKAKTAADFILGNRSLNFYVTALSAHASDMSSWLFMAYPALVLIGGGVQIWVAIGLILGMWANWQFIAPRLRKETEKTQSLTLSAYFAARFNDTGLLRTIGGLLSLFFFTIYVSAGLVGMGFLFEGILGVQREFGITLTLVIVILYTWVGGYTSICWIDLWQALFLMVMIVLVPIVALTRVGGWESVIEAASSINLSLLPIPSGGWSTLALILFTSLGWGLGYFGQTHILTKFMGIRNPDNLKKAKRVGLSWQVICLSAASAIGLIGIAFFPQGLANPEQVFVLMVKQLFHPFFAGVILCAIFAATISTIDSQLLVLTSVLSEDFYHRFFRQNASPKEAVWASRISILIIGAIAYGIAMQTGKDVLQLVFYSWSGLGSTFGPVLILALYVKQTNRLGALTGMLYGGVTAAAWPTINAYLPIDVPALIPGFLLNLLIISGVSRISRTPSPVLPSKDHRM